MQLIREIRTRGKRTALCMAAIKRGVNYSDHMKRHETNGRR